MGIRYKIGQLLKEKSRISAISVLEKTIISVLSELKDINHFFDPSGHDQAHF